MNIAVIRASSSLLSSSIPCRCPYYFATTSACKKTIKRASFIKRRENSAVKGISTQKPSQGTVSSPVRREPGKMREQQFDYFLVLDFEATCCEEGPIQPYPEIIEFPVAKLDVRTWTVTSYFHQYVRPTANPNLTSFCTHLTGIIQILILNQEMVDDKPKIDEVLQRFHLWMEEEEILNSRIAFVTCGDWDLGVMLPSEASNKGFIIPEYLKKWINVKKSHCDHTGFFAKGLRDLLNIYNIQHAGRLHSGIDDVKTICAITSALGKSGYVFGINGTTTDEAMRKRMFKNVTVQ